MTTIYTTTSEPSSNNNNNNNYFLVVNTSENSSSSYDENKHKALFATAQEITGLYLLPVISIIGICGNICNVLVFTHSKKYSTNVYLIALSLSDILKLANDFIYFLVTLIGKLDPPLAERLFLTLYLYSHYVFVMTALNTAWLTCVIAIDRYVTVSSRNQVKTSEANYFKSILISLVITFTSGVIALPSPIFLKPEMESRSNRRLVQESMIRTYTKKFYNYFNAAFRAFIPIILLIYLNFKIIRIVYRNNKTRKKLSTTNIGGGASSGCGGGGTSSGGGVCVAQELQPRSRVTTMLLMIVFSFVICVFPDAILTGMQLGYANENFLNRAIREVTDLLLAVNSAVTFFICYAFSLSYRQKFSSIFGCGGRRHRPMTSSNTTRRFGCGPDENGADSPATRQERLKLVSQRWSQENEKDRDKP